MRCGYIKAKNLREIDGFKSSGQYDKLYVDLIDSQGKTKDRELKRLFAEASKGDTLVIKSFDSACNSSSELCSFLETCKEKGLLLASGDEVEAERLLLDEGYEILRFVTDFVQAKDKVKVKKLGRPQLSYPDNFWQVYLKFRQYEGTGINSHQASEELGININTFYKLVREFEL
ncbi:recombinase family protein [Paenibacillus sp. DMB5]|uniref:recombinase family protein n=1 Tax=Paenibacillus sp. DMB5 TaxID=1780103 RepID=UPI00076C98E2|nr:recombinase family protein [Paenibacillus sp. DMB5]KUP23099.1 hypothetical protein AWJ19_22745 [Paenibacillus sp. DMB5]